MGERGRAPTPTSLMSPDSRRRKQRAKTEPKADLGEPALPFGLSEAAQNVWSEFVEIMPAGVLTRTDGFALGCLCEVYIDWRRCVDFVREHGEGIVRQKDQKDGKVSYYFEYFPQAGKRLEYEKQVAYWLARFGLTPADRARVVADKSPTTDNGRSKFFRTVG